MNHVRSLGAFASIVLLLTSCTSANAPPTARTTASATPTIAATPTTDTTPSPVAIEEPTPTPATPRNCPSVQPAPRFAASAPSSRSVALVWLRGSERLVMRDITDFNRQSSVTAPLPFVGAPLQLVSATDISPANNQLIFREPLSGGSGKVAARLCLGQIGYAWSRDGTTLAYVTDRMDGDRSELHLVTAGTDRVVSTMPHFVWGVGCAGQPCEDSADARLLFSPDGRFISLVQVWGGPELRVWTSTGKTLKSIDANAPSGTPTMSVWSGKSLYFRDTRGVVAWRDGQESLVLGGLQWIRPKASPAGGQIVYMARKAGAPGVYMLDTTSGAVRLIKTFRSEPAFLTSRYIWYQGERSCTSSDPYPCGSGGTTIATGRAYIYDLQTGTETESTITKVWDVWPHPA